jgi:hypothetical protein
MVTWHLPCGQNNRRVCSLRLHFKSAISGALEKLITQAWKLKEITPYSEMYKELYLFHPKTKARDRKCL